MSRISSLLLSFLVATVGLFADAPSHLLPPPDGTAKIKAATPGPQPEALRDKDDVQVQIGDARMVPRLIRRAKGSYETIYDAKMVMPLWTKPRFQTMITLPKGEQVMEAMAADDDVWEVLKAKKANLVFVKPKYENSSTSVTVITSIGTRYIFEATSGEFAKGHEIMQLLDVLPPAWLKQKLEEQAGGKPAARGQRSNGGTLTLGSSMDDVQDGISPQEAERLRKAAYDAGQKTGYDAAMSRRDDELREYAASIFLNANMDYKWSKGNAKLRVKRIFDDGRVTYILFESATNTQPAFWEIVSGKPKEVGSQTAVFLPNLLIVNKLVKEGTLSIDSEEIKVSNLGWSFKTSDDPKVQLRGEKVAKATGGAQ